MENTEAKKRPYTKPEIEVIELPEAPQLLSQSDPYGRDYMGEGR